MPISRAVPSAVRISIGVLAHNEEHRITATLESLFEQDLLGGTDTEIVVVANGCTDATAPMALGAIEKFSARGTRTGSARVEVLPRGGKANAWNEFVHRLSSRDAEILVLMDADIWFLSLDTLSRMIATLEETTAAVVCVDRPVKDIERQANRTLFQRMLASATPEVDVDDVPLCGQLYCAWSESLRGIHLPPEIQIEDGFIRALLLTRGFSTPEDRARIVLAQGAAHGFAAVGSLSELLRHERWVVAGSIVNMMLFRRFGAEVRAGRDAMDLMRTWGQRDRDWLPHLVEAEARERGWRLLPRQWWTRRWTRLQRMPFLRRCYRLPVALLAAAFDAVIFLSAIRQIQRGRGYRYWRRA